MAKEFNPFEHHHEHHHHDAPITPAEMDPAQRSLADALRVCFVLLKLVMLVLVVLYAVSGLFNVKANEQAVVLRLGKITTKEPIGQGGPHWSWPFPIGEVIKIPTSDETLELSKPFWYQIQAQNAAPGPQARPLNPEIDGSNVTGDKGIVHTRWVVTYYVDNPNAYVTHLGSSELAEKVVRNAAEQGVVHTIAQLTADQVMKAEGYKQKVASVIQRALNDLSTGIVVRNVTMTKYEMPGSVRDAYNAVTNADTDRERKVTDAEKEASKIVREAAGEAYRPLWELIRSYEDAVDAEDDAKAKELGVALNTAFETLVLKDQAAIGGLAAALINDAKTYRTQVVEQVKGEADRFEQLLPHYKQNPEIVISRLWTETREAILAGDVESFYAPPGRFVLELNRDPEVEKRREQRKLEAEQELRRLQMLGQRSPTEP